MRCYHLPRSSCHHTTRKRRKWRDVTRSQRGQSNVGKGSEKRYEVWSSWESKERQTDYETGHLRVRGYMLKEESTAGYSCWVEALSLLPEAESLWGLSSVFFLFLCVWPFTTFTLFYRNLEAVRGGLPHLQQTAWATDCTDEILCPLRDVYKPIHLPCQMWAGNPSSWLLSFTTFALQAALHHSAEVFARPLMSTAINPFRQHVLHNITGWWLDLHDTAITLKIFRRMHWNK